VGCVILSPLSLSVGFGSVCCTRMRVGHGCLAHDEGVCGDEDREVREVLRCVSTRKKL
jgi:hypothetical protein